jgi:diaminobutyrate-2-oxoglutarate transaminase
VTATKALDYWTNDELTNEVGRKTEIIESRLGALAERIPVDATLRGRGFIQGIAFDDAELAGKASAECFKLGLVIETAGIDDQVLKLLPPLTISDEDLEKGLSIIEEAVTKVANEASTDRKVA